uniref:Uncharacterized protein n=1 Tax=viral metagenome TaxID=1070528 RepID=A0A6M3LG79_9ZZZZ
MIGKKLLDVFETALDDIWVCEQISYKKPIPNIAKMLLKEVVGYIPEKGGD